MVNNEKTIRSVITPNDQFLRTVFSTSKAYFIDIYQREYKWTPENVETLLRDIEARFSTGTRDQTDPKKIQAAVQEHFEPYFLNTYLTHSTANNIFIVDGQQRLTTFLLILIRLYQILKTFEDEKAHEEDNRAENRWTNFSKYVLMRIDRHLCSLLDKPSYAAGDLEELEGRFNKTTRRRHGMHLEHIYAYNDSNIELFTDERGSFDEQQFKDIRDRLGMVLLLKDRQNLSSGNEIFTHKVETYKKSNFLWNEILVGHLHSVDVKRLPEELQSEPVGPDSTGAFPKDKVDERQRLLFNVIKRIWCDSVPSSTQVSFNGGNEASVVN